MRREVLKAVGDLLLALAEECPRGERRRQAEREEFASEPEASSEAAAVVQDIAAELMPTDWLSDRKTALLDERGIERRCRIHYRQTDFALSPEGAAANLIEKFDSLEGAKAQMQTTQKQALTRMSAAYLQRVERLLEWAAGERDERPGQNAEGEPDASGGATSED